MLKHTFSLSCIIERRKYYSRTKSKQQKREEMKISKKHLTHRKNAKVKEKKSVLVGFVGVVRDTIKTNTPGLCECACGYLIMLVNS